MKLIVCDTIKIYAKKKKKKKEGTFSCESRGDITGHALLACSRTFCRVN